MCEPYFGVTSLADSHDSRVDPTTLLSTRRRVPRFNFVATAELTDPASDTHLSGRISEISRNGCYVDILNALPIGTALNVRVSCDRGTFTTKAKIIYVHENIGMGVGFVDTPKEQLDILDSWLSNSSLESGT